MFHHSKSGAFEGREEAKKIAEVVVTTWEQISESPKFGPERPKSIEKLRVFALPSARRYTGPVRREQREHVVNSRIASRGRERKQFAPPVRRFGTKRRFRLRVSAKMPTFAAAIPPQSAARQGSPVVFAAAEALFTTFLKH